MKSFTKVYTRPRFTLTWKKVTVALASAFIATLYDGTRRLEKGIELRRPELAVSIPTQPVPRPGPGPSDVLNASSHESIVALNLFSSDRSPIPITEPPGPEVVKPMPPLPIVFGVASLPSGVRVLMAENMGGTQKLIRAGDSIGEYTVVAVDSAAMVLGWEGARITRRIADLTYKPDREGALRTVPQTWNQMPGNGTPATTRLLGREVGGPGVSRRECIKDDSSPPGTVLEGYRKLVVKNPFGAACSWVPTQ